MVLIRIAIVLCFVLTCSSQIYAKDSGRSRSLQGDATEEKDGVASDDEPAGPSESTARKPNAWCHLFSLKGELSAILSHNDQDEHHSSLRLRYIPELKLSVPINDTIAFDADAAMDANTTVFLDSDHDSGNDVGADLYRLSSKLSTNQLEVHAGLQEINFGSARILRSLMWFDQIDPFDPLERTDGVKALLVRYFFLNNANIWLWGLYGNDNLKGMEFIESKENTIEWGGRCQVPVPSGEMALSYHQRKLDPEDWLTKKSTVLDEGIENRLAMDAFWDIKIGLWFELVGSETRFKLNRNLSRRNKTGEFDQAIATVGSDYTFENGVHLLGEYFLQASGEDWGDLDTDLEIAALSGDYNLNQIDRVIVTAIYDLTGDDLQGIFQWQRTYDIWQLDLTVFGSTDNGEQGVNSTVAGSGFTVLLTYYH